MSAGRIYAQHCPVARAVEKLGGRWTLLILRELGTGPKRYTDLVERLPGISTTILVKRIHQLIGDGIIRKDELPPPAASIVYVLTELGTMTAPLLRALATFGAEYLDKAPIIRRASHSRPIWIAELLPARWRAGQPPLAGEIEFRIDEEIFTLYENHGAPRLALRAAHRPLLVIRGDREALAELATGRVPNGLRWTGPGWKDFLAAFAIQDDRKQENAA